MSVVTQRVQVFHIAIAVSFALSQLLVQEGIVGVNVVMSVLTKEQRSATSYIKVIWW